MSFKNPDRLKNKKKIVKKVTRQAKDTNNTIKVKKPNAKS